MPNDADQSKTIVGFWLSDLGVKSAYLVDDQSSYATGLNDEVEGLLLDAGFGRRDINRASFSQEESDFSSVATNIIAANPDVVFFPNQISSQAGGLITELRAQGYQGVYFMPDGGFSLEWVGIAGAAAEGAYVTFFAPDPNLVASMAPYNDYYRANIGEEFGAFGGAAAFATYVGLEAIRSCAAADLLSRDCVVGQLETMQLDSTPLGVSLSFGEGNQAVNSQFFLFQVKDGQFTLVER
ncbi:MAG: ABC transporter substrate-binding protein [Deinococcales bacterium]